MSGRELQKEVVKLGITTAALSRASAVSVPTIVKIYNDDDKVREESRNKVINAFRRLRAQQMGGEPPEAA